MNLGRRLTRWTEAGLLTPDQADAISAWEREQPSSSWVLFGITGVGIVVLMTGIVSVIAANWDRIPVNVKLGGYFVTLALLGWTTFRRYPIRGAVREGLLTAYALYVLAGIGLIRQIFHISSNDYEALFLWIGLILPTALLAQSHLVNHLWCVGLLIASTMWLAPPDGADVQTRLYTIAAVPWFALSLGYLLWKRFEYFARTLRVWSFGVLLLGYAVTANIAWSTGGDLSSEKSAGIAWPLPFVGALLAIVSVSFRRAELGRGVTFAINTTLVMLALLLMPPIYGELSDSLSSQIIGCLLFIGAWAGAAAIAAGMERRRLFDFAALVIAIRFIVVYFEVFGSLGATGFGLILSGGVILGVAYLWHRYRAALAKAIREGM